MADKTLIPDVESLIVVSEGDRDEKPTSQPDYAEFEKRLRASLEASHQFDAALASVRSETYQQIAEAKRAGASDQKVMDIERLGFTRSAALLTRDFPSDPPVHPPEPPPSGIALATEHLPLSDVAKLPSATEQIFVPPYDSAFAQADPGTPADSIHHEELEMLANRYTGEIRARRLTGDRGGSFVVEAGVHISFQLNVKPGPDGSRPLRFGMMRLVPTFSPLEEAHMVSAARDWASSLGAVLVVVSGVSVPDPRFAVRLWDEVSNSYLPPTGHSYLRNQWKTVPTDWFEANSLRTYSAFVAVRIWALGGRDGDNSYARALASVHGRISSVRVQQFFTD